MITKLFEVYRTYFLISIAVFALIVLANFEKVNILWFIPVFIGCVLLPFVYELDYIFYAYLIEPESKFSNDLKQLILVKNYRGAFVYAHENENLISNSVVRSVLTVVGAFGITFLSVFTFTNLVSQSILLTFLLTSIYLQTLSFFNGSWRNWYNFLEFVPKIKIAKLFLAIQGVFYIIFLFQLF